jgi:hypothetical protein
MKKVCAFCPNRAVEKGGEHVWDNWLNKELPETRYKARKRYTLDSPVIEYDTDSLSEKLPVVCSACNNGWMSALSQKVKDSFGRTMLEGEPFSLGTRDAAVLAAFTFLKAVVTDHLTDGHEPIFTRAARERFRMTRTPPPLIKVWFASCEWESRMSTRNNLSIYSADDSPLCGIEFCSFTYIVGKLALQLLAPRWKNLGDRGRPLVSLTPNVHWEQAAVLFWPHTGGLLSWPPPKHLADDAIQAFVQRFGTRVDISLSRQVN